MASVPLVALAGKPVETPDVLGQYGKLVALKSMLANQQFEQQQRPLQLQAAQQGIQQNQLAIQQAQLQHDSELGVMKAYTEAGGDLKKAAELAPKYNVLPKDIYQLQTMDTERKQKIATLSHTDLENADSQIKQAGQAASTLLTVPPEQRQQVFATQVAPQFGIDASKMNPQQLNDYLSDDHLKFAQTQAMKVSEQLDEQRKTQAFNQEHGPLPPDKLQQINSAMASRYQVLNPGKQLPDTYQLPAGATVDDFTRTDKLMEQKEKAQATQAQLATANGFRAQASALANLAAQEKIAQLNKPTADEQRRSDLAQNLQENMDSLADILKRRPDLFGPVAGRLTGARAALGTSDQDVAQLETIKHQLGMAQISAHGMRSAQGIADAAQSVINNFHNSPEATQAALNAARNSVSTFQKNEEAARSGARSGITPDMVPGAKPKQVAAPQDQGTAVYNEKGQLAGYSHDGGKTYIPNK